MTAIRERGETPFEAAGEGVVLCFFNSDLKKIQNAYDANWLPKITSDILAGAIDIDVLETLVAAGAKKDRKPFVVPPEALDRMVLSDVFKVVLDALYTSVHGQDFEAYVKATTSALRAAEESGNLPPPQSPDTTTSTTSDDSPSGPASASTNSGQSRPAKRKNS